MANTNSSSEVVRPLANFPQDIWGDRFLSIPFNNSEFESYSKEVEALKEMVKDMLMDSTSGVIEKVFLVYSLYRLGVSYHFENEIEQHLNNLFNSLPKVLIDDNDYDLHTVAIIFQVFRFHGYKMVSDVFSKFQLGGKFKEELTGTNVKGILSLYEASHFIMSGEVILDEALAFTSKKLQECLANQASDDHLPPHLREHIVKALFLPYHRSMQRYEARQYISFYEKDESRSDVLLKFAKYDFNRVQMLHQQEVRVLSSWYKEINLKSKLPFARHRVVEGFFYALMIYFEPRYALARNTLTKTAKLIAYLDDGYEAYGLYEELQYFTEAIERFDTSSINDLPEDWLKIVYETILHVHDEVEDQLREEGRSYSVSYVRDEFKKYTIAEHVEARWKHEGYAATFDEYLENGLFSSTARLSFSQIMIGMEQADKNAYEWVMQKDNKFVKALQISTRLSNDIATNEAEEKRGIFNTGSLCYMRQHKVSCRKEATNAFREMIEDTWKVTNEGNMRPTPVDYEIMRAGLNYQRMLYFSYRENDGYTKPETFKPLILELLVHPIPLE